MGLEQGQRFGITLRDSERHRVVDVLVESSADALATWSAVHPGITTITRDWYLPSAEGARRAAPNVTQFSDRFHSVRKLRQAVKRELAVHRRYLCFPEQLDPAASEAGWREEDEADDPSRRALPGNGRAVAPVEAGTRPNNPANEGGGDEGESNRTDR